MKRKASCCVCALLIGGVLGSVPMYAQVDLEFVNKWYVEGSPAWVAVHEPTGEVLSNVNNSFRVVKYSSGGDLIAGWLVVAGVIETNGITVGPGGEGFVTISNNYRVAVYSAEGERLGEFGDQGSEPGRFLNLQGIALTSAGLIYIANSGNDRIQVIQRLMP